MIYVIEQSLNNGRDWQPIVITDSAYRAEIRLETSDSEFPISDGQQYRIRPAELQDVLTALTA